MERKKEKGRKMKEVKEENTRNEEEIETKIKLNKRKKDKK